MIWLVAFAPAGVASLALLWVMFVLVMTMEQLRDAGRLSALVITIGESIAGVGVVWDVMPCNLIFATVLFFELPRESTLSARLRRLVMGDPAARRTRLAVWCATTLMNPFCPVDAPHIPLPSWVK